MHDAHKRKYGITFAFAHMDFHRSRGVADEKRALYSPKNMPQLLAYVKKRDVAPLVVMGLKGNAL